MDMCIEEEGREGGMGRGAGRGKEEDSKSKEENQKNTVT